MREIELHDDVWPGLLGALAQGDPAAALRERWPDLAALLEELAADARREPLLVGVRLATPCRNSRLFALLVGAGLARMGSRTIVLDLSPDTRWLEQLLGEDFKEGLVDHLRFGVPLERCVRASVIDRFAVLSAGAAYLAGSPLDDAPGLRSALERLRQRHRIVLVTLPPPLDSGDRMGIVSLCGTLVTVEEQGATAPLLGSERAIVRLAGDPEAARDLAHLTHRFLGPLSGIVAGLARLNSAEAPRHAGAEVAPLPAPVRRVEDVMEPVTRVGRAPAVPRSSPRRVRTRRPRGRAIAVAAGVILVLAAVGVAARERGAEAMEWWRNVRAPAPASDEVFAASDPLTLDQGASVLAPVTIAGDSAAGLAAAALLADSFAPAPRRTPYSLHVGSYQRVESAMRVVARVEEAGLPAYLAPVSLPGKGSWQRVYVGAFADSLEAARALASLRTDGVVEEGAVRPTPWAFELGFFASAEDARAEAEILRRAGIIAYVSGRNPVRLYAGAFQSREEADLYARMLDTALDGRPVTLMLREE